MTDPASRQDDASGSLTPDADTLLEALSRQLQDLLWVVDTATQRTIYLSPAFDGLWGRPKEQFIGEPPTWVEHVVPSDREMLLGILRKGVEERMEVEFRLQRPDGSLRWMRTVVLPLTSSAPDRIAGVAYDITEQKRQRDELELLHLLTRELAEEQDLPTAMVHVLRHVCEFTNWSLGEAWLPSDDETHLHLGCAWYRDEDALSEWRDLSEDRVFRLGEGIPGGAWYSAAAVWAPDITRDPTTFPRAELAERMGLHAGVGIPVLADDEVVAVLTFYVDMPREEDARFVDLVSAVAAQLGTVVRRRAAEQELRVYSHALERTNDELEEYAKIVAHDLQEPVRDVVRHVQRVELRHREALPPEALEDLAFAVEGARRMHRQLRSLLEFTEVGEPDHPREVVDLDEVLDAALDDLSSLVHETGAVVARGPLAEVHGVPADIHSLVKHLLENAILYRNGERPRIHVETREADEDQAELIVRDHGRGVPSRHRDRVFGLFQRLHPDTDPPGDGVGLSLCRKVARAHGGSITMRDPRDGGPGVEVVATLPIPPDLHPKRPGDDRG